MKKTLNKILGFSLFVLLSSFSLFANAVNFDVTFYAIGSYPSTCPVTYAGKYHNKLVPPNTMITNSCTSIGGSTGSNSGCIQYLSTCSDGNQRYGSYFPIGGGCPTNSTLSGSTCTPNSGYSAVNTDPTANGGRGSWVIRTAGQECTTPSTTYNTTTGVCDTSTTPPSAGIMSSAAGIAAIGAGVIIGGISLILGAPVLAIGAAAVAAYGALAATSGLSASYSPQTPQEAITATKPPLTVIVNPDATQKQQVPNDGNIPTIIRDTDTKTFKPGGGASGSWQQGATGSWEYGVQVPPSTVRIPRATISPDGREVNLDSPQDQNHTVPTRTYVKNFDDNSILVGWGANLPTTDSNNNQTFLPVADVRSFDSAGTPTGGGTYVSPKNTNGTDSNFTSNTPISSLPPSSGSGTGSGSTGTGSSYGGGPCTLPNGQPCASDTTLQQINQSLNAGGENLTKGDTSSISEANAEYTGLLESVMNPIEGITNFVPSILPSAAPVACKPIDLEINFTTGVLSGVSTGKSSIDICNYLEIFRDILSWLFSISTIIYIWRVFTRVNSGGEQ